MLFKFVKVVHRNLYPRLFCLRGLGANGFQEAKDTIVKIFNQNYSVKNTRNIPESDLKKKLKIFTFGKNCIVPKKPRGDPLSLQNPKESSIVKS